jgi:uncharacterized small protein (DUF1192 family)
MLEVQMTQFGKLKEYESKIYLLTQEIERLTTQISMLRSECEDQRYKNEGLEQKCLTY